MLRPVYINGKFYAGGLNGVHRVADRLIRELDALLAARDPADRPQTTLLLPHGSAWAPSLDAIDSVEEAGAQSQRWEQLRLPRRAADGVLVNLCNLAPLAHARKLLLIHDAQFLFPDSSYPARQRIGYRLLVPRMARSSGIVLTVSDYSRAMLDLLGVAPRARTGVLYNGADHILQAVPPDGALAALGLDAGGYVLLFGSAKGYKNNAVILCAFDEPPPGLRLVIVGPGHDELAAAGLAAPAGTVFAGKVDDHVLRALYEGAHALAFPSRTEGFGLPPVEAMLCGCPVVAAPAGAIPEVCGDAVLYAGVDRPEEWRAMFARLADPATRAAKIAAGRERAGTFTWARAGRHLLEAILSLAAR